MRLDASSRRSVVGQDQQPGHRCHVPFAIARHISTEASLSIETPEHRLDVRDHRLDFDDEERPRLWMETEYVDRASFASNVERRLRCGLPPVAVKQLHHAFHEAGVPGIEQAVQTFALPQEAEVNPRTERACNSLQCLNGHPVSLSPFDPPDHRSGHASTGSQLCLGQTSSEAKRPQPESEADDVHGAQHVLRPFTLGYVISWQGSVAGLRSVVPTKLTPSKRRARSRRHHL